MSSQIELGLDTFGDVTYDAAGKPRPHAQVIRDVVAEAVLADQLGVDFIGLGEHHRADFAISSPEMVLAAIAGQTTRIRLGSAVTVLSSDDPVRVFQRFSTLDAVSHGRAEIILGRGSFTESFPLFGFALDQYETLFEDRLELFTQDPRARSDARTPDLAGTDARAAQRPAGASADGARFAQDLDRRRRKSRVRRARREYRLPLMLAIIGGDPRRFKPYVDLFHEALEQSGGPELPIGVHSPGYVAETDALAREQLWPAYQGMRNRIGAERGWGPTSPEEFEREIVHGSLYVGSPDTVAKKIANTVKTLGVDRFDMKYSAGSLAHEHLMRCIELYGREVMPRVRDLLATA